MTDSLYAPDVSASGGTFVDLFGRRPIEAADAESIPVPSRYVSFAGHYAESVIDELLLDPPSLILYDTFSVIAPLAARRLGVPYVNVCSGHAAVPEQVLAMLQHDPRVETSEACRSAVERLKAEHQMATASPFSYVDGMSPYLNVYCEPPQFLDDADRAAFEPVVFFGSLTEQPDRPESPTALATAAGGLREGLGIYVSFGTVVWKYFEAEAFAAMRVLCECLGRSADIRVSLGGHALEPRKRRQLQASSRVQVLDYVDQRAVLAETDVFVTHHGLNSTHEAIDAEVPMLSYPFFADQPKLAGKCAALGIATPIAASPRCPLDPGLVQAALQRIRSDRLGFAQRLKDARSRELETMAARGEVVDRILALVS
jgi:UDP:flavonoid glycosyltransferase YjiC (YdhE family)